MKLNNIPKIKSSIDLTSGEDSSEEIIDLWNMRIKFGKETNQVEEFLQNLAQHSKSIVVGINRLKENFNSLITCYEGPSMLNNTCDMYNSENFQVESTLKEDLNPLFSNYKNIVEQLENINLQRSNLLCELSQFFSKERGLKEVSSYRPIDTTNFTINYISFKQCLQKLSNISSHFDYLKDQLYLQTTVDLDKRLHNKKDNSPKKKNWELQIQEMKDIIVRIPHSKENDELQMKLNQIEKFLVENNEILKGQLLELEFLRKIESKRNELNNDLLDDRDNQLKNKLLLLNTSKYQIKTLNRLVIKWKRLFDKRNEIISSLLKDREELLNQIKLNNFIPDYSKLSEFRELKELSNTKDDYYQQYYTNNLIDKSKTNELDRCRYERDRLRKEIEIRLPITNETLVQLRNIIKKLHNRLSSKSKMLLSKRKAKKRLSQAETTLIVDTLKNLEKSCNILTDSNTTQHPKLSEDKISTNTLNSPTNANIIEGHQMTKIQRYYEENFSNDIEKNTENNSFIEIQSKFQCLREHFEILYDLVETNDLLDSTTLFTFEQVRELQTSSNVIKYQIDKAEEKRTSFFENISKVVEKETTGLFPPTELEYLQSHALTYSFELVNCLTSLISNQNKRLLIQENYIQLLEKQILKGENKITTSLTRLDKPELKCMEQDIKQDTHTSINSQMSTRQSNRQSNRPSSQCFIMNKSEIISETIDTSFENYSIYNKINNEKKKVKRRKKSTSKRTTETIKPYKMGTFLKNKKAYKKFRKISLLKKKSV
ncbi:unnamed protein product [Dimorphilus gyrociliatus]|uniref:Uncharacterized protein n=1 Tax=Dimorphilus gyrociliatus TaxID=2664684 RepID=A0A7I8VTE8_9ANNE|nr:unnamed protein product [Dimorphilus gyrociliatus]